jgi:sulfite reductase alpha subunit-like flavoprotein
MPLSHCTHHIVQLSVFATEEEERSKLKELSSAEGVDLLVDYCTREKRTYQDVLGDFPSARPPLSRLVEMIALLQPRHFSIASSILAHPRQLHLCVAVVQFQTPYKRVRTGVCSSWLASLAVGDTVPLWTRPGLLRLPAKQRVPILMVGPGTGVAPFRAMLEERAILEEQRVPGSAQSAEGGEGREEGTEERREEGTEGTEHTSPANTVLYFGCRHEGKDFLYGQQFQAASKAKTLTALHTAFSRDQERKIYVQHRLHENKDQLWEVISQVQSINSPPPTVISPFTRV